MGHAAAEAVVRAGLNLVPYTLSGYSAGVAVANIGVLGVPVELVGKDQRQEAMSKIKETYPNLVVVDYTTPYCVNGMYLDVVSLGKMAKFSRSKRNTSL